MTCVFNQALSLRSVYTMYRNFLKFINDGARNFNNGAVDLMVENYNMNVRAAPP